MKFLTLLILVLGLTTAKGQTPILDIVNKAIDSNFVITYYHKPASPTGIILFEEVHNLQLRTARMAEKIFLLDSQFNKVVLEGLYYDFGSHKWSLDSFSDRQKSIYSFLAEKYLHPKPLATNTRSFQISNAEYLHLKYPVTLLRAENEVDYHSPKSAINPAQILASKFHQIGGWRYRAFLDIYYSSEENYRAFLERIKPLATKLGVNAAILETEIRFSKIVSKRTDTIVKYATSYYLHYPKLFSFIGASHTSRMVELLRQADVPFVVVSEKEILYNPEQQVKPEPVINKASFKKEFERTLLSYLYADFLQTPRKSLPAIIRKVTDSFYYVKKVVMHPDRSLSYKVGSVAYTFRPTDALVKNRQQELKNINLQVPVYSNPIVQTAQLKEYSIEHISPQLINVLKAYLNSEKYESVKNILKYSVLRAGRVRAATETDFTDKYLAQVLDTGLSIKIITQNSISKGKRPDWSLICGSENYVAEVKYVRNANSLKYALDLLHNHQIESYVKDDYLNPKHLDIIILFDRTNLQKLKIPETKLKSLKSTLELHIQKLRTIHPNVNFGIHFLEVLLLRKSGKPVLPLC